MLANACSAASAARYWLASMCSLTSGSSIFLAGRRRDFLWKRASDVGSATSEPSVPGNKLPVVMTANSTGAFPFVSKWAQRLRW
jgi:hypothetical protein